MENPWHRRLFGNLVDTIFEEVAAHYQPGTPEDIIQEAVQERLMGLLQTARPPSSGSPMRVLRADSGTIVVSVDVNNIGTRDCEATFSLSEDQALELAQALVEHVRKVHS